MEGVGGSPWEFGVVDAVQGVVVGMAKVGEELRVGRGERLRPTHRGEAAMNGHPGGCWGGRLKRSGFARYPTL